MALSAEKWMEIVVGGIIVALLLFVLSRLYDVQGSLSGVSTKVDATDQRVARIADVLPEVRARVAWEEINEPFTGFVVSAKPKQISQDRWMLSVKLYDATSGNLQTFAIVTTEEHRDFLTYFVAGKVKERNPNDPSFADLASYSSQEKVALTIPNEMNSGMSFVLRKEQIPGLSKDLKTITGVEPESRTLGKVKTWKELAPKLREITQDEN